MYTLDKNTEITNDVIRKVIDYNEAKKARYDNLKNYYLGDHEILKRSKVGSLSNNKVVVNHAKYITDTNTGYLMGNPVDYQVQDAYNIDPLLDQYKKQTINDLDSEIAKNISIYGVQYEYVYANEEAEPRSAIIDNRNAVLVYDNTIEHNKLFGLIYRPVMQGQMIDYWDVIYCDKEVIKRYKSKLETLESLEDEQKHQFGEVPLIKYKNNPELQGDFEQVISLIDAYNTLQSDRINDKEQLVDAILCLYGMSFDEEQAEYLREYRMLAEIPVDGKVDYLTKTLQEGSVDILRANLENDIHKITMTPNMSDENFMGNSSGVALRYKLLNFEQAISNKKRYMEKGLLERFKMYNNFLITKSQMQEIPTQEVDVEFKRNLPSNDFEISHMINNLLGVVDKELLVSQLSFVKDASEIVELAEEQEVTNHNHDGFGNLPEGVENGD